MKLQYTHSRDLFRAMCKARDRHLRFRKVYYLFFWAIVILNLGTSAFFIFKTWGKDMPLEVFVNAGIAIALLLFRYFVVPWQQLRFYKLQNLEGSIIDFEATDEHVVVANKNGKTIYQLEGLERIDREDNCIIFWTSKIIGITIPMSAMKPGQYEELKQLVVGKVKECEL